MTVKLRFFRIFRAEWFKLFSLRSAWWLTGLAILANIGLAVGLAVGLGLIEGAIANYQEPLTGPGGLPIQITPGQFGLLSQVVVRGCASIGLLLYLALAITIVSNEYSSGMIRSTVVAAPKRAQVLIAKLVVSAILAIIIFASSLAGAWFLADIFLQGTTGVDLTLTSPDSLRILGGYLIEVILLGWFFIGLASWIRSTIVSVSVAIAVTWVVPLSLDLLVRLFVGAGSATGWQRWLVDGLALWPTKAGGLVTQTNLAGSGWLNGWTGLAVLGGWVVASLAGGFFATVRRSV